MKWTDQQPPAPERDLPEGGSAQIVTGQDGRLGYDPNTAGITTIEQLKGLRNERDV